MFTQLFLILVLMIPLVAIVLDSQLGRALASRLEQPRLDGASDLDAERIAYLEGEVERLANEVMRLAEEGQFVHQLLTEGKNSEGGVLPPSDDPA